MAERRPEQLDAEDAERFRRWERKCAKMQPMTQEAIEAVAVVLRRIDERRAAPRDEE